MAELVYKDPYLLVNSVDLSDYVRQVTINYGAEILDKTAGTTNSKEKIAGLKDWSLSIELNQDFATSAVDDTLFDLVGAAEFAVVIKPNGSVTGSSNPSFSGNGVLASYPPLGASVGQLITTSITIEGSGDLSRATT